MQLSQEIKSMAALAWPVVLSQLGLVTLGLTDILVVGQVSEQALAAVSLGHLFSFALLIVCFGILRGIDPFVSQAHGAGRGEELSGVWARSVCITLCGVVPVTLAHLCAQPILAFFEQPAAILPITGAYSCAVAAGVLPVLLMASMAGFLQGMGRMHAPMVVVILSNVLNVGLNLALVLGVPALSIPAMEALGSGVATTCVRWSGLVALAWLSRDVWRAYWPDSWREEIQWSKIKPMLRVGGPVGLQSGLEVWAFSALGLMMGVLGEKNLAAHAVAMQVISVSFMIPSGIGVAASTRVGNLIGQGRSWRAAAWIAVGFAVGWMAISAGGMLWGGRWIARAFTQDEQVIQTVLLLFPVAAGFQLFDGVQVSVFGVLRGAGDTVVPSVANIIGYWLVGLPLAYLMGIHLNQDPVMLWGGIAVSLAIISVLLLLRMRWLMARGVKALGDAHAA